MIIRANDRQIRQDSPQRSPMWPQIKTTDNTRLSVFTRRREPYSVSS
jgi:hypothetical protein